jgi:hypothetical protein
MCEHNSYDVPACAIWKLSFWAVLVSIAFALMLLIGPFSGLLIPPRLSRFSSHSGSAPTENSANPTATSGRALSSTKVWVDTETGIYHKSSGWVDESGRAKLMTESDAVRAGYRSATTEYHRRF